MKDNEVNIIINGANKAPEVWFNGKKHPIISVEHRYESSSTHISEHELMITYWDEDTKSVKITGFKGFM